MKRTGLSVIAGLLLIVFSSPAMAHMLWVNVFESYTHPPGHVIASIGFGHVVPMDDLLNSESGQIELESFTLIDPNREKTALSLPEVNNKKPIITSSGLKLYEGDLGNRKFGLTDNTKPGTYHIVATSKESFFTAYIDKNDKPKMVSKSMDKIKDAVKITVSFKYKAFAKAFFTVKGWTNPGILGHNLEIMPATDLSDVHVGNLVPFEIIFMGKPLQGIDSIEYITARSNTYGGPDGFFLSAEIYNGKAQFRMPTAGQWLVQLYVRQEVTPENDLKELADKCTTVFYSASISFNVKP